LLIIGEKINGTRKEVAAAIAARDADKIRELARTQVEAGANYLDVNAGTSPDLEPEVMRWLVRTVQQEVDTPLSIDTPNPLALAAALDEATQTPLVNSISGETERLERILPQAAEHGCPLIMLALDDTGMPKTVDDRMRVIGQLLERTDDAGIPQDRLFIDPLIMAISTGDEQGNVALETMRRVREQREVLFSTICKELGMTRESIVVTFLAILELIRRKRLSYDQQAPFDDIRLFLVAKA